MSKLIDFPVMNGLGKEEDQRKYAQQAELCARGKVHGQPQE
jgi:hypothetical protein